MPELNRRYVVMALGAEAPFDPHDPDGVFVLKPWKDPAALRALAEYRDNCYPELAADLTAWITQIEQGPVVRGDVGRRNEPHVQPEANAPHETRAKGAPPMARATARKSTAKARSRAAKKQAR
jgi:hypothetical protein